MSTYICRPNGDNRYKKRIAGNKNIVYIFLKLYTPIDVKRRFVPADAGNIFKGRKILNA